MVIKLFLAFLTGISVSLFFDSAFSQEEVAGRAKVISGDTLSIKNIEDGKQFTFRLWGIDAPELDQPCEKKNGQSVECGVLARNAVRAIIKRSERVCGDFEKDSENQITALCYMGDKILNGAIVRAGWALAYKQESTDFLDVEKQARLNDKGVWEYNFIPPWTWRKNQKK